MRIKDQLINQMNKRAYELKTGWKQNNKQKVVNTINSSKPSSYAFISEVSGKIFVL